MNFDFDFFRKNEVYVHIKNERELKSFLIACKNNGIPWWYGEVISPEEDVKEILRRDSERSFSYWKSEDPFEGGGIGYITTPRETGYHIYWGDCANQYQYDGVPERDTGFKQIYIARREITIIVNGKKFKPVIGLSKSKDGMCYPMFYTRKDEKGTEEVLVEDEENEKLLAIPFNIVESN